MRQQSHIIRGSVLVFLYLGVGRWLGEKGFGTGSYVVQIGLKLTQVAKAFWELLILKYWDYRYVQPHLG